jgi:hypothetical protein
MSTSPKVELVNENNPYEFTGSSTQATENDTVSLHCPVIGYPNPEVIWLKDGNPIGYLLLALSDVKKIVTERYSDKDATIEIPDSPYGPFKKYILIGNGYKYNLQINQVTREDEGFYK